MKAEAFEYFVAVGDGGFRDPGALVDGGNRLATGELSNLADGGGGVIADSGVKHVAYIGSGGVMQPLLIFASARAAIPCTPINYRLSAAALQGLIGRLPDPPVIVDESYRDMTGDVGKHVLDSEQFLTASRTADPPTAFARSRGYRGCVVRIGYIVEAQSC